MIIRVFAEQNVLYHTLFRQQSNHCQWGQDDKNWDLVNRVNRIQTLLLKHYVIYKIKQLYNVSFSSICRFSHFFFHFFPVSILYIIDYSRIQYTLITIENIPRLILVKTHMSITADPLHAILFLRYTSLIKVFENNITSDYYALGLGLGSTWVSSRKRDALIPIWTIPYCVLL
jgi:hypothetical protein